jgi:high-affinity iron transporter
MHGLSGLVEGVVISLREGVEVALVIGILFAYLRRTGREGYLAAVWLGLGAALLASLGGALLVRRYGLNPDNPTAEGSLMLVAAALVASLLYWMWRTGKTVRRRMEQRLERLVDDPGTLTLHASLGIFAFTFFMVLREGVETVLFLLTLASTTGAQPLATASGTALGLTLALCFGVLLVRGSVRINLQRFFAVTGSVLVVLVLKLLAGALHEFFEAHVLSSTPALDEAVELFASSAVSWIVLALLVVAPLACLAWDWWRTPVPDLTNQPNGARS